MPEYCAFGLHLSSDFELPHLRADGPVVHDAAVTVVPGRVPEPPAEARTVGPTMHLQDGDIHLAIPGLARFLIRGGREIIVEAERHATPLDFAPILLGPVLAHASYQHGLLPVHASAVQVRDGCVLFVSQPCAGKSTVAAALSGRGHAVVADDLCVIHVADDGLPLVFPGPPILRLWPDALAALGARSDQLDPVRPGVDKYILPVPGVMEPIRVRHVVVIDAQDHTLEVDRRTGIDSVTVLIASSWGARAMHAMGMTAQHFALCASVAKAAAIWHWARPSGVAKLPGSLAGLEAAWRAADREFPHLRITDDGI